MHWELSDEQEMFASSLREWITAKFPTETVRELQGSSSSPFTDALIGEGWWGVGYPEQAGGQGGGVLELALAAREFGRAAVPDSGWFAAAIVAPLLTDADLTALVEGQRRAVLATRADRPPVTGPDAIDAGTAGDTLSLVVPHVLGAAEAEVFVVPVRGPDGPALAQVAAADAVITADDLLDRSRSTATVEFRDAPVAGLVPVDAESLAASALRAPVLVAADALGAAERMLDLAVGYSKQRKQFGQLIGGFQAVKHACAQMLVTVEASYSSALYAAAAVDAALADAPTIAAVAKAQVTRSVADLADTALTVHGAIGYTWEHDLHLFYKRAKLDRTLFGTPAAWNERIAVALLGPVNSPS
ncbi:acyl-CoA dehydrogenase family protein [Gordonia sp. NB41Y]|uniref:acyl-CoA dehydrogenase family protein n=1 Tax=Gordonia sp. NB41Y TaxID=875808 RepID=UPI0006B156DC|nr:acyl-CoA dehydrogenase family protein [Gordonia sp. NB41Y]EMP10883.2 acyl-CoA dehydrogenase [Gordonia sp. NB41Y]WLP89018.1 acyl-CoA dehydrogenase family protein [Gordonia sp. NB41Y]